MNNNLLLNFYATDTTIWYVSPDLSIDLNRTELLKCKVTLEKLFNFCSII